MHITPISEGTLMVEFSAVISIETTQTIADFVIYIQQQCGAFIIDIVPSYTKVMLQYKLGECNFERLQQSSQQWYQSYDVDRRSTVATIHHLAVYYHPDVGPDL